MSVAWVKNLVGFTLSDEEMKNIPRAQSELYVHVIIKSVQAFGLIGTLVVGPISAMRRPETRSLVGLRRRMTRCGLAGVALGCLAGPVLTYARLLSSSATADSIYDKSYRLRHNRGQVRVDRGWLLGLFGGAGLSIAVKKCPMFGGLVGMSAGVITAAYCNSTLYDKPAKSEEMKTDV